MNTTRTWSSIKMDVISRRHNFGLMRYCLFLFLQLIAQIYLRKVNCGSNCANMQWRYVLQDNDKKIVSNIYQITYSSL